MRMKLLHTSRAKSRWQCGQGKVLDLFPDCFLLSLPPPPEDGDVSMSAVVFQCRREALGTSNARNCGDSRVRGIDRKGGRIEAEKRRERRRSCLGCWGLVTKKPSHTRMSLQ